MNIAAAVVLALALALPAAAAPVPAKKILGENVNLTVLITVNGPGGTMSAKSRVQAQSQFSSIRGSKAKGKSLEFSAVPVINPNNGKVRMEYKGRAVWSAEDAIEFMSAVELELGEEAVVYDSDGMTVRIKITSAE